MNVHIPSSGDRVYIHQGNSELLVRQNPDRAKLASGEQKDRKPVDPPPVVQLKVDSEFDPDQNTLQNPHYFLIATLHHHEDDRPADVPPNEALCGTTVSSISRLKDIADDDLDAGFFVFGDLSVRFEGIFRLKFSLYELRVNMVSFINSIISEQFTVYPARRFPGMAESTEFSRSLSDQGIKLRIRKEPRTLTNKRNTAPPQPIPQPTQTPPQPEYMAPDYAVYYEQQFKRPKIEDVSPYGSAAYTVQSPYPSQSPYHGQPTYQGQSPYQGQGPYQTQGPYQGQSPYPGQGSYQGHYPFTGHYQF